jgi:hypothetical protein
MRTIGVRFAMAMVAAGTTALAVACGGGDDGDSPEVEALVGTWDVSQGSYSQNTCPVKDADPVIDLKSYFVVFTRKNDTTADWKFCSDAAGTMCTGAKGTATAAEHGYTLAGTWVIDFNDNAQFKADCVLTLTMTGEFDAHGTSLTATSNSTAAAVGPECNDLQTLARANSMKPDATLNGCMLTGNVTAVKQ